MEVKDLPKVSSQAIPNQSEGRQVSSGNLISSAPNVADVVDVSIDRKTTNLDNNDLRAKVNAAINVTNVAEEATAEVEKLVKSLEGIVEVANDGSTPNERLGILDKEVKELVSAIGNLTKSKSLDGIKPLAGDPIRLDLEQKIGRTLEFILPDHSKDAFGLEKITVSKKEAIINTIATVEEGRKRLENLKASLDDASKSIRQVVSETEVALLNRESSEASLRDVDSAIKLANQTKRGIGSNPDRALRSTGDLSAVSLKLLE